MQTLQKTVGVHLSLPEANPFVVYLKKVESRGRNTPDPRGLIFLSLGVLVERDTSVSAWSFCKLECIHCLGTISVAFLRRCCMVLCHFLAWWLCFFCVYKVPSHSSLQWALLGPLPSAAWWWARWRDTGTWNITFPGAPPPFRDRNQGLLPYINLAVIIAPLLNELVPLAWSKSSWFSLSSDSITSWAPVPGSVQVKRTCSCTEILERSFREHPGSLQLIFSFHISHYNCLPKELGSHLPLSESGAGNSFSSLWDYSACQGLCGPQQKEMQKQDKFSFFQPVAAADKKIGESDRAGKTLSFRQGKVSLRKVRTGKHKCKVCKDVRESLK